jgi:hypothetical protein
MEGEIGSSGLRFLRYCVEHVLTYDRFYGHSDVIATVQPQVAR